MVHILVQHDSVQRKEWLRITSFASIEDVQQLQFFHA
jgi:hypothetical protein